MPGDKDFISMLLPQMPLSLGEYMRCCNAQYYNSRDPLGREGDFITAPEVSQMFGELVGLWLADYWMKIGQPSSFVLLECGPGRGTFMSDILRSFKSVPGILDAVNICLLENSSLLIDKQKKCLQDFDIKHLSSIGDLSDGQPIFIIGNEFLDALPTEQYKYTGEAWQQKFVQHQDGQLEYAWGDVDDCTCLKPFLDVMRKPQPDDVMEISPERDQFVKECSNILQKNGGAMLWIDYGFAHPAFGESFQAIKQHEFIDPLEAPGQADLTTHVDFASIARVMEEADLGVLGPVTQGGYLNNLGLQIWAGKLKSKATPDEARAIDLAYHRLTSAKEMGQLFKVIAGVPHGYPKPDGFNQ